MDNIPPQSLEMEESIIASCLIDDKAVPDIIDLLSPDDFYRSSNKKIFQAITDLANQKEPIDLISLTEKLKGEGFLSEIGGAAYLARIIDEIPMATNPEYTAGKLRNLSTLRKMIDVSREIQASCFGTTGNVLEVLDNAQKQILAIDPRGTGDGFVRMGSVLDSAIERLEEMGKTSGVTGVPTGFTDLDRLTAGFQGSDLITLAARPSMGKTALALNMAGYQASKQIPVSFFSLEMAKEQLTYRQLSGYSGINSTKFRTGNLSGEDWQKITKTSSMLYEWPLYIDDIPSLSYGELRRRIRRGVKGHGSKIVYIDYLGFIEGDKDASAKTYEIQSITRALKGVAKEFNIPVVLICQLNRDCEKRPNKRPILSDLRDSGSIEQDSDVVLFLYRDAKYVKKLDSDGLERPEYTRVKNLAELDVAKQRNGPTDRIGLVWQEEYTRFQNYQREERDYYK